MAGRCRVAGLAARVHVDPGHLQRRRLHRAEKRRGVAGDARARMLASFARRRNLDLSRSYAYADSISDLPMLEAVGNPVAVNPDRRLTAAAKDRGWRVEHW
ncbi:MAG: haloacid dehalogenase-like hydrolase, partial [Actinobacteria bacterium]|nr:haloacid dehalogenase-like hydrolase [Actinomycetota bacterium]